MQKNSFSIFTVVLLLAAFTSCNKTEVIQEVYVDSYIHSFPNNAGVPVYTMMHSAYSFTMINSIGVTGTTSPAVQLVPFSVDGLSFYNKPDSAAYKPTVPAAETFTYNVIYENGVNATKTNAVGTNSVAPVQQLTTEKTATDIKLSWKAAANTEAYKVRIFSEDLTTKVKTLIYETNFLVPKDATSDLTIPFSLISLSPYLSNNLIFEVSAFIFETGQDTYQAISVAQTTYGV